MDTVIAAAAHEKGALLIAVVSEIVSLGSVKSPGAMGADIVVAEGQSIGNGLDDENQQQRQTSEASGLRELPLTLGESLLA